MKPCNLPALAALLISSFLPLSCSRGSPEPPIATAQAQPAAPPVPVTVVRVGRRTLEETVQVVGTLVAERRLKLAPEVGGRVSSVAVEEGDRVQAGQVLARLFDHDVQMRLAAAEAELRTARQRAGSADTDVEIVGTDTQLTEAQAAEQLRVAQARLAQAQNEVRLTEEKVAGDVELAKANLAAAQARVRLLNAGARSQEIQRARADVEGARASAASAEQDVIYAERAWQRKTRLVADGAGSQQVADDAERDWQRAKANVRLAHAHLQALEQALKLLEAGARPEEIEQAQAAERAAAESLRVAEQNRGQVAQKRQDLAAAEAELSRARKALQAAGRGEARVRKSRQDAQAAGSAAALAEANLRLAREELAKTLLRSPIAGAVSSRQVDPGETVIAGHPLLEIVDLASLYLEATTSDRDVLKIRAGQRAGLRFEALKGQMFTGLVREVLPPVDPQGRRFRVKIALPRKARLLHVGMAATGTIVAGRHDEALALPVAALTADTPEAMEGEVYVVKDGIARRRRVILGARGSGLVEVRSGLREGDTVVIDGQPMLKDGRRVQARPLA